MPEEFDTRQLVDLDECVLGALDLFQRSHLPDLEIPFQRPMMLGSGNAAVTGRIITRGTDAVYADESTYQEKLKAAKGIDGAVLISASGGKHAPIIAKDLKERGIEVVLLTNNPEALAAEFADKTHVYPKQEEPYTYNTSTYMGMILSQTKEDPKAIQEYLLQKVLPEMPNDLHRFDAYCMIVPNEFDGVRELFLTKFDELFGPMINGRVFTVDQMKHAKTITPSNRECFLGLGVDNRAYGDHRMDFPLPEGADHAAVMALGYFLIGHIQGQNLPWFKNNILKYTEQASGMFGQDITPLVRAENAGNAFAGYCKESRLFSGPSEPAKLGPL